LIAFTLISGEGRRFGPENRSAGGRIQSTGAVNPTLAPATGIFRRADSFFGLVTGLTKIDFLVQEPDGEVEIAGEGDPGEIGNEEPGGGGAHLFEGENGEQDGGPERDEVDEGGQDLVGAEENPGPEKIETKLHEEEAQAAATTGAGARLPDDPGGDGHEHVEQGPNQWEDRVGWVEGRLDERGVPGGDSAEGKNRRKAIDSQAEGQPADKSQGGAGSIFRLG